MRPTFLQRAAQITRLSFLMTVCPSENRQAVLIRLIVIVPAVKAAKAEPVKTMTTYAAPKKSVSPKTVNVHRDTKNVAAVVMPHVEKDICAIPSLAIVFVNRRNVPNTPRGIRQLVLASAKTDMTCAVVRVIPCVTAPGMTGERDPDTCACTCIEGTNADTCACPAGYVYINGQCQRFECKGGPTEYTCYINGERCGYSCNSVGKECARGICYADECPDGSTFTQLTTVQSSGYWYGCRKGRWRTDVKKTVFPVPFPVP